MCRVVDSGFAFCYNVKPRYWLLLGAALAMGVSAALALHRRKAGKGGSM